LFNHCFQISITHNVKQPKIPALQVLCITNEPTAAIAYGPKKKGGESEIIVYNLGG
jgi:molecular chaperone DnaK (HSP70)